MMRALYSGVAGLKTHQTKMDVIGNNIANVNTVSFKSSSVVFSDLMYQTTSGASGATATKGGINPKQIGLGSTGAATNISITQAGASQTTGNAFDIKLADSNSTNFFIVNNGAENLFTRAGSFTVDAAGNLVMTSTGYNVMGWQVDPLTGDIKRDTVSKLQIMSAENMTSAPEATTNAYLSGVIDKNDTDVNSDNGYAMNLNFYDSLGYSYTAQFATKKDPTSTYDGAYTVELTHIYDSEGNDMLADWLSVTVKNPDGTDAVDADGNPIYQNKLSDLFGNDTFTTKSYSIKNTAVTSNGATLRATYTDQADATQKVTLNYTTAAGGARYEQNAAGDWGIYFTGVDSAGNTQTEFMTLSDAFGISKEIADLIAEEGSTVYPQATVDMATGTFVVTSPTTNHSLVFDLENVNGNGSGALNYVGATGLTNQTLMLSKIINDVTGASVFEDIDVDFRNCLNYDNGKTSTLSIDRGATDGTTGLGKKLGALTGISIDNAGRIFGSYDNGNTTLLGQIPVAQFANASGLEAIGNSIYKTTLNSGDFDGIGVDATADGGGMSTGQLEMSNVDLASEFTDMITTQRGFQANSRIITTSDTLLEELINLKR